LSLSELLLSTIGVGVSLGKNIGHLSIPTISMSNKNKRSKELFSSATF
jgi:hypothetical protein